DASLDLTQMGYARQLLRFPIPPGDFLEVGPDVGRFAADVLRAHKFPRAWLLEPNVPLHAALRDRVAATGTEAIISTEMTDLSAVPDGSVAAAVMIHVLDHLPDPLGYLRQVFSKLVPGGLLYIVVHDERSLLARVLGGWLPIYCIYHPELFNPTSLRNFVGRAGGETLEVARSTNHFPVTFLARHALRAVRMPWVPVPKWNWPRLPLQLGNLGGVFRRPPG
ncbi:MAG: class I SAM-dependent methyltransferase, partial [Fimbriiglobus sp.]